MRRHLGIMLSVLFLVLAACTETDAANPTQANSSTTPTTSTTTSDPPTTDSGDLNIVVANPKHLDENTRCEQILTAADVSAATGTTAKLDNSASDGCQYDLADANGEHAGLIFVLFTGGPPSPSAERSYTVTTLNGNTAVQTQYRDDPEACDFMVVLDSENTWRRVGAALTVMGSAKTNIDRCKAMRTIAEKGISRLPDA